MDGPAQPPDGELPPGDGDRRGRDDSRFSSSTLAAVIVAAVVAVIAVLLGLLDLQGGERPQPQSGLAKGSGHPVLTRIHYDELRHAVKPYLPLYKKGLPPFHKLHPLHGAANTTRPVHELRMKVADAAAAPAGLWIRGIDPTQRFLGVYPTVGKVVSAMTGVECTGVMVSDDVMLTADHCLPWDLPVSDWTSIRFIPAYDASANPPELYGEGNVVHCVGVNPVVPDGRDMAVCKLSWSTGKRPGYVKFDWPDPDMGDDPVTWYQSRGWYSIGYPYTFASGESPALAGPFDILEVEPDNDDDCRLLKTAFFADHGWSGGPVFNWVTADGSDVSLSAIASRCAGPLPSCVDATTTILAAGMRMSTLVTYGILAWDIGWDPAWGFSKSPE